VQAQRKRCKLKSTIRSDALFPPLLVSVLSDIDVVAWYVRELKIRYGFGI